MSKRLSDDSLFRIPPYFYLHVLDQNTNVSKIVVGPKTYIRQDNERFVYPMKYPFPLTFAFLSIGKLFTVFATVLLQVQLAIPMIQRPILDLIINLPIMDSGPLLYMYLEHRAVHAVNWLSDINLDYDGWVNVLSNSVLPFQIS